MPSKKIVKFTNQSEAVMILKTGSLINTKDFCFDEESALCLLDSSAADFEEKEDVEQYADEVESVLNDIEELVDNEQYKVDELEQQLEDAREALEDAETIQCALEQRLKEANKLAAQMPDVCSECGQKIK